MNSVFLAFGKTVLLAAKTVFTQITIYLPYTILHKVGVIYPNDDCLTATAVLLRQGEAIMMDTVILMVFSWVFVNARTDIFKDVKY